MSIIETYEVRKNNYLISTDQALLDLDTIHGYLERSYWSPGIPKERVARAIDHSLCFGVYAPPTSANGMPKPMMMPQVGFARMVTDYTSFAYLADVFILPSHQGHGLGTWMIEVVMNCPALDGIRSCFLATRDAHGLYEKFGFAIPGNPNRLMIKRYTTEWLKPEMAES